LYADSAKSREQIEAIRQAPALVAALNSDDFLVLSHARHCLGIYQMAHRDGQAAVEVYQDMMEAWRSDREWINAHPELFLASFNNYLNAYLDHVGLDTSEPTQAYFSSYKFKTPRIRQRYDQIRYMTTLISMLNSGSFDDQLPLLSEIESWLEGLDPTHSTSSWLAFQYNLSVYYFFSGAFSKSNQCVQEVLNLKRGQTRMDIRQFCQLFQLILYYELGESDLIEFRIRSVGRALSQSESIKPLWKAVAAFFKDWETVEETRFEKLEIALKEVTPCLGLGEVQLWVCSHREGVSLEEAFRNALAGE